MNDTKLTPPSPLAGANGSAAGETEQNTPCWCGEPNPYYAQVPSRCGGNGYNDCLCGGDLCVCHNHGEVECFGCPDCESDDD